MTHKTKFKSDAFEAIHDAARGLHRIGTIDKATMREFDESHVSQPVFARYLNTSESTIQKWEAGTKRPSGMALKLLTIVEKHGLQVLA